MKVSAGKKETVTQYLLEKIAAGEPALSRHVSEVFGISQNTVHTYLNELLSEGIIEREKRGAYRLAYKESRYDLKRSAGDLKNDFDILDRCLKPMLDSLPKNIVSIWNYAFSEMANNVIDHSGAENLTVTVRQDTLTTSVILRDDGVGIFEKIRSHFSFDTLDDAICELFKGKLTTDKEHHSGEGIFFTSKMMDSFRILSDGKVFSTDKYDNTQISVPEDRREHGTCVIMSLSNMSKKTAAEIFDLYSDVDGGFTRTRIPLKNIFDSDPVSRSQAKRVCSRLGEFEEVVLDFDAVEWIGQGFAHEIFSVWQKEHPDVHLVPVNMCEDIAKMLRHVTR